MLFASRAPLQDGRKVATRFLSIRKLFLAILCLGMTGFLCSCALLNRATGGSKSESESASSRIVASSTNSHGYALLYDLVKDEKDVSKLRFIKHERTELKSLLQEIARVNHDACSRLEAFAKTNHEIDIKNQGLPAAEVQARGAIGKFKQSSILHSKDKDLEIQLLLSENEALTYGSHLAQVVSAAEADPSRKQFLQQLAATLSKLQGNVIDLLRKHYSWP
jgi:hypothetical protein